MVEQPAEGQARGRVQLRQGLEPVRLGQDRGALEIEVGGEQLELAALWLRVDPHGPV